VILSRWRIGFRVVESGILEYDGSTIEFVGIDGRRTFLDEEVNSLLPVRVDSSIKECQGFQFFRIITH
jgi:hypothetical protein